MKEKINENKKTMMMTKRRIFYLLSLIGELIFLFFFYRALINLKSSNGVLKRIATSFNENIKYPSNNFYVTNNNIALYSSYIIIDNDNENEVRYRIEAIVEQNGKWKEIISRENITCVLKYFKDERTSEIIELDAIDIAKLDEYHVRFNRKIFFNFKLEYFKSFEDEDFHLNRIVIAVILKDDFDKSLKLASFLKTMKIDYLKFPVILPYSLITFQKPEIIRTQVPRISNIAVCGAQFYGNESKELFNWIEYHQSFGIAEIMIYDGTINRIIMKFINEYFKRYNRVKLTMVEDQSLFYEQCNETIFYDQFKDIKSNKLNELLFRICKTFFDWSHRSKPKLSKQVGWTANEHRIVVLNDCFTKLSKKYEYVGIYDFDEFIYPRQLNNVKDFYEKKALFSCKNKSEICSLNPFGLSNPHQNHLYNYLIDRLNRDQNKRDLSKFAGFQFKQVETFTRENEKKFLESLESLIINNNKNNSTIVFPQQLTANLYHYFQINKNDIDYVNYLLKSYKEMSTCIYSNFTSEIELGEIRAFYYLTTGERHPKSIHHYKNTRTLDIHYVSETVDRSWIIIPSEIDGHFSAHYRPEMEHFKRNFTGSIRDLNIDFEYLFFILKKYAKFC